MMNHRRGITALQLSMVIALMVICLLILIGLGFLVDEPPNDEYSGVAFSPTGQTYATVGSHFAGEGFTDVLTLWDVSTQTRTHQIEVNQEVTKAVTFSPNGELIATIGHGYSEEAGDGLTTIIGNVGSEDPGNVMLWDVATVRLLQTLTEHSSNVWDATFSPDGKTLATCGRDQFVILWDVTKKSVGTRLETEAPMTTIAYSPDGSLLVAGTGDPSWRTQQAHGKGDEGQLIVWDTESLEQVISFHVSDERITSLVFSPNGTQLACGSADNTVTLWTVGTWELERSLENLNGHEIAAFSVEFSPDGNTLATGHHDMVRLWDTTNWSPRVVWKDELGLVTSLSFSPDGKVLAVSCDDGFQEGDPRKFIRVADGTPIVWREENPTNLVARALLWCGFLVVCLGVLWLWGWGCYHIALIDDLRSRNVTLRPTSSEKAGTPVTLMDEEPVYITGAALISGLGIYCIIPGLRGAICGLFPGIARRSWTTAVKGMGLGAALDLLYTILWPIAAMLLGITWEPRASYSPFLTEWLPSGSVVATHMGSPWPNGLQFATSLMVWTTLQMLVWLALWHERADSEKTIKVLFAANSFVAASALILWIVTPLSGWWRHGAAPFGDLPPIPWTITFLAVFPLSALATAFVLKRACGSKAKQ